MQIIKDRNNFPKCIRRFEELKGISIGKCIDNEDGFEEFYGAHSHSVEGWECTGWICLKREEQLKEDLILLHEVAHLLVNKKDYIPNHGKRWRQKVIEIGGTLDPLFYIHKKENKKRITRNCTHYAGFNDNGRKVWYPTTKINIV